VLFRLGEQACTESCERLQVLTIAKPTAPEFTEAVIKEFVTN
jgi:hypothetical protein